MPFPPRFRTCLMTGCEYCRGGGRLLLPRAVNCRPQTHTLFPIVLSFPSSIPLPTVRDSGDSCAMQTKKTGAKRTPPTPSSSSSSSFLLMGQSLTVVPPRLSFHGGNRVAPDRAPYVPSLVLPQFSPPPAGDKGSLPPFVSSHSLLGSALPNGRQKGEGSLDFVGIFMARRHRPARPFSTRGIAQIGWRTVVLQRPK